MRAILLAAGMGTRLRPLTLGTPKSLIEVNGKPLLERQVEYLKEKGVEEIIVVTGYLAEKFDYLKEKYGVKLVHNDKYDVYNNIYTMYLVRKYLEDTYVVDADVYIAENFLLENPETSMYFSANKKGFKGEWKLHFDENLKVTDIEVGDDEGYILCGVSYWSKKDTDIIVKELETMVEQGDFDNLYWDDIVKNNIPRLDIRVQKISEDSIYEIDNLDELNYVKSIVEK
ncbi:NTP transferase domain-containing protein [Clostridium sp. B9]|uniref:NTP transferase domain-containing protein n=1 Tax=Clostridium sp. B9 TaxID=3423224 RepID=UPI003D2EB187